jgi:hypothetical protein
MPASPRNARQEAFDRLGGRYEVRVLEPSPPAEQNAPWFADDPVARGELPTGREVVSPVSKGDLRWSDLTSEFEGLKDWCEERWLIERSLPAIPSGLEDARLALHKLAEQEIASAREAANGKIGLRWTLGGFGTPFFGDDMQIRVEGDRLITDSPAGTEERQLEVDPVASGFLGDVYGFGCLALEQLRAEAGPELEASRVQIWPEHFDIAAEFGAESAGDRAAYGFSPGDEEHDEPYLYVAPWSPERASGELWNSAAFKGAELSYSQLLESQAPLSTALDFFRARMRELAG